MRIYRDIKFAMTLFCSLLSISPVVAQAAQPFYIKHASNLNDHVAPPAKVQPTPNWSGFVEDSLYDWSDAPSAYASYVAFTVPNYKLPNKLAACPYATTYIASIWGGVGGVGASAFANDLPNGYLYQAGIQLQINCNSAGSTNVPIQAWTEFYPQDAVETFVSLTGGTRTPPWPHQCW